MEHHALGALIRRSGPESRKRALLLFYCFRSSLLRPTDPPKDRLVPTDVVKAEGDDGSGGTHGGTRLSIENVVYLTHAMIMFDGAPPKFVFAVAPQCIVLRSADRGKTWRKVAITRATTPPETAGGPIQQQQQAPLSPPPEGKTQLEDILALLPSDNTESGNRGVANGASEDGYEGEGEGGSGTGDSDNEDAQGSRKGLAATRPLPSSTVRVTAQPDLLGVACRGDAVAVCGDDGMLAVSIDRGVTFCVVDPLRCLSLIQNRTKSKHELLAIRCVVFLSESMLAFHTTSHVCRITFRATGLSSVVFDVATSIVKFPRGPIGCLLSVPHPLSTTAIDGLWVSTMGALHWIVDGGRTCGAVLVPHSLGLIRCLALPVGSTEQMPIHPCWSEALEAVGVSKVSQGIPMDAQVAPSSLEMSAPPHPTTTPSVQLPADEQKKKVYSFSIHCTTSMSDDASAASMVDGLETFFGVQPKASSGFRKGPPPRGTTVASSGNHRSTVCGGDAVALPAGIVSVSLLTLSAQGRIVPYDFTAFMHILVGRSGSDVLVHSTASRVDYIPFVQSTAQDKVGLAITPRRSDRDPAASNHALVRSTASGLSRSTDYGATWSPPTKTFTGTCCRLDEGCFVIASMRKSVVVTEDYGATFVAHALPTNFRVAVVSDVGVMR